MQFVEHYDVDLRSQGVDQSIGEPSNPFLPTLVLFDQWRKVRRYGGVTDDVQVRVLRQCIPLFLRPADNRNRYQIRMDRGLFQPFPDGVVVVRYNQCHEFSIQLAPIRKNIQNNFCLPQSHIEEEGESRHVYANKERLQLMDVRIGFEIGKRPVLPQLVVNILPGKGLYPFPVVETTR